MQEMSPSYHWSTTPATARRTSSRRLRVGITTDTAGHGGCPAVDAFDAFDIVARSGCGERGRRR